MWSFSSPQSGKDEHNSNKDEMVVTEVKIEGLNASEDKTENVIPSLSNDIEMTGVSGDEQCMIKEPSDS